MIGLNRHIVQVVEHHPSWAALAADACQDIWRVCGNLLADLQHVGSTSVPDLPAKPILDIAAAVVTLDTIPALVQRLTGIGYLYRGDGGEEGGHLFVRESSPDVRTLHLHVVEHHGTQWRNYLCFRDLLRQHPEIREQYAALKQELGNRFRDDRKSYTDSKHDFIRGILETQEPNPYEVFSSFVSDFFPSSAYHGGKLRGRPQSLLKAWSRLAKSSRLMPRVDMTSDVKSEPPNSR